MYYNNMMNPYGWGGGYGMMQFGLLGWIFMVLWWVIVIAVIVWVIRAIFGRGRRNYWQEWHGEKGPLEILKERYAKGEIDKSEYEEKKKDLEK
ncbi:MAG: SHOCT domain-containing protein [Candidatus Wolfebacteria bacterium]|nr:SHOCT domain-containing protein [Candidatus Wolfebacteria bacterium]